MAERPAPTPQALREQAQRATRLADGIIDEQARTILLDFAQELFEKAAHIEAVMRLADEIERHLIARNLRQTGG